MFVIGIRRCVTSPGWRCLHHDGGQILARKKIRPKTSGIIVTGDEVLKGQVLDTNSHFLCKKLYEMGIRVLAVSKVADDLDVIAEEVRKYSEAYDYVITTGGIGPTHDDITYEAVAKAFGDTLHHHPDLMKLVLDFYKTNDLSHPALKMACIPKSARVTYGRDPDTGQKTFYPSISIRNVHMFPGVPYLCEKLFDFAKDELFGRQGRFHTRELYLTENEGRIVHELNSAVDKFPSVVFGSYPKYFHSYYSVKITMESADESETVEAYEYLRNLVPNRFHVDYDRDPFRDKSNKLRAVMGDSSATRTAFQELESVYLENDPADVFIYFDGDVNSTVLVHMAATVLEKSDPAGRVNAIYVETNPKVGRFVDETVRNYNLNLLKLTRSHFLNFSNSSPKICVVKGIRRSEPDALKTMEAFGGLNMVNPLIDWTYRDVWHVVRSLYLPYCELYDRGYTSIRDVNAVPNPNLRTAGPRSDLVYYKKAYELADEALE